MRMPSTMSGLQEYSIAEKCPLHHSAALAVDSVFVRDRVVLL